MKPKAAPPKSKPVKTKGSAKSRKPDFSYALKSFLGHLEGSDKASHTIKNYRLDVLAFQKYLADATGTPVVSLEQVRREHLEAYQGHLETQGLKTNTRRRKLLTVRKFLAYLSLRKQVSFDVSRKLATPHKIERVPYVVPVEALLAAIRALPRESELDRRNRLLLWILAETGCQVSEVAEFRAGAWRLETTSAQNSPGAPGKAWLEFAGKNPRSLPVAAELVQELSALPTTRFAWLFSGYNKFGPIGGAPITPRGVELLVQAYSARLGVPGITPRTFRHSAVVHWFRQGLAQDEIQRRLGLKTAYAFRSYLPIFQSIRDASRERTVV